IRFCRWSTGGFSQPLAFFGTQVTFADVFAQILEYGAPPKDYRRERNRSLSHRCLHSSFYLPVVVETVRLFLAEGEQFRFVCYRTKVRFLAVTAWAAWSTGPSPLPLLASPPAHRRSAFYANRPSDRNGTRHPCASRHVNAAAGGNAGDKAQRPCRIGLRPRHARARQER